MKTARVAAAVCLLVLACVGLVQASRGQPCVYFLSKETAQPAAEARGVALTPEALIEELLKGPTGTALYSPFAPKTRLLGVECQDRTVTLDFNEGFLLSASGSADKEVETVIRLTLSQIPWLDSYRVTVNGREVSAGPHIDFSQLLDLKAEPLEPHAVPQGEPVPHLYAVIDPGHGGSDPGAYNWEVPGSVLEKDVVLDVGTHVYQWIDGRSDATAYMTRSTDVYRDLAYRVNYANSKYANGQCNVFISIHSNSQADTSGQQLHTAKGIETFYKKGIDQEFAADVHSKAKQAYFGSLGYFTDRGTTYNNYQVLRDTLMPACLVEAGFISNTSHDYSVLSSATHREEIAYHIYLGIRYYWWGY